MLQNKDEQSFYKKISSFHNKICFCVISYTVLLIYYFYINKELYIILENRICTSEENLSLYFTILYIFLFFLISIEIVKY